MMSDSSVTKPSRLTFMYTEDMREPIEVQFKNPGSTTSTVLDISVDNSVGISHSCGGMGTCGTCCSRVQFLRGPVPERNEIEAEMASERGFRSDERLVCQVEIPQEDFEWVVTVDSNVAIAE